MYLFLNLNRDHKFLSQKRLKNDGNFTIMKDSRDLTRSLEQDGFSIALKQDHGGALRHSLYSNDLKVISAQYALV